MCAHGMVIFTENLIVFMFNLSNQPFLFLKHRSLLLVSFSREVFTKNHKISKMLMSTHILYKHA